MVHSKSFAVINVDIDVTGQLQTYTDIDTHTHTHTHTHCIRHILEKKSKYQEEMHQLFIRNFEKAYNSGMREILYHILTTFCVPKKIITLTKVC